MLLLFVSGAASLIYQILWIKQLALVVGVEVQAVTTGVSAFFAGLALGGCLLGRVADRSKRPLRVYAALEVATLLLAIASTVALPRAAGMFALWQDKAGLVAWALPCLLVGLPAMFMGGTLPVLLRAVVPAAREIGRAGGLLYAANTAGAIAGTLAASFVLIPSLGVQGSAFAAAVLNAGAALMAIVVEHPRFVRARRSSSAWAGTSTHDETASQADIADTVASHTHGSVSSIRLALALYGIAGGIALGYEVVWSQAIAQFISTRSFAFSVVLATYLCGLMAGSALVSRRVDRARDPWGVFGLLIASAGLVALLQIAWLGDWLLQWQAQLRGAVLAATGSLLTAMCVSFAAAALSMVFVPTLLLGAALPFALRLGGVDGRKTGRGTGIVVAANTVGGIAGTLLTGFVLIPALGLVHTLAVLAVLAGAVGLAAAFRGAGMRRARARMSGKRDIAGRLAGWSSPIVMAVMAVTCGVAMLTPADRLATLLVTARGGSLVSYEESQGGTVAVVEQGKGDTRFRRLYIQGVSNSGDAMTSLRYMRVQALLPLIIHRGTPRSALVIGAGTGITGGALLNWPGLEHRVVAELLPAVVRAVPRFNGNYGMSTDPHIEIRLRDGRRELLRNPQQYDLITLEPPPPSAAGVVNLYSSDFYRLAASRLQAGGFVAQWLPLPTQNEEDTRSLIRSFVEVFPYASLWTTELHETMLVGSMTPIELDVQAIRAHFAQPGVAAALKEVGIASPAALLAGWITDRAGLAYYAADAPPVTDDQPRIEYASWVRRDAFPGVLGHLLALRTEPPLSGADDAFRAEVVAQGATLQRFYQASLDAYRGDREAWRDDIQSVMRDDPNNPYYRWFVGGGQ
jgi:spermidine synthase